MINSCVLVGRLTRDPEMRYTQNGIAVTTFRIAVDRPFGRDEEGKKQTDFIDIVTWRKTAELAGQYLGKGAMVGVEGRIQMRSFTTQDGQQRQVCEVVADRIAFLESKAERERREARQQTTGQQAPPPAPEPPGSPDSGPEPLEVTDADDPFSDQ